MITTALQQLTIFVARLVVQVRYSELSNDVHCLPKPKFTDFTGPSVYFYLVRCVGVSSVIGENKLSCDWSE